MRILGLDPSTQAVGVALLNGDQIDCWTVDLKGCRRNLKKVATALSDELAAKVGIYPDVVAIERPFVKFPQAALAVGKVAGMLYALFCDSSILCEVSPQEAAKAVMGKAKHGKVELIEFLRSAYYAVKDEHQAAALACALSAKRDLDILGKPLKEASE